MLRSNELEPEEDDIDLPVLYSQRAITGFSIFFSVLFGAVLMMANLRDNPRGRWTVFGFAFLYTGASAFLFGLMQTNALLAIALNGFGGAVLTNYFWNKYIGRETVHIARPIWWPLIISIAITIPLAISLLEQRAGM